MTDHEVQLENKVNEQRRSGIIADRIIALTGEMYEIREDGKLGKQINVPNS